MRAPKIVLLLGLLCLLAMADTALAGDTTITWQVISNGGTNSSNNDYVLKGTIRQTSVRLSTGGGYADEAGFWPYIRSLGPCCMGIRGNVDGDPKEEIVVNDLTYLTAFLFQGGPAPTCTEEGDVDGSGGGSPITVDDVTYLVAYLFQGGPAPGSCP